MHTQPHKLPEVLMGGVIWCLLSFQFCSSSFSINLELFNGFTSQLSRKAWNSSTERKRICARVFSPHASSSTLQTVYMHRAELMTCVRKQKAPSESAYRVSSLYNYLIKLYKLYMTLFPGSQYYWCWKSSRRINS